MVKGAVEAERDVYFIPYLFSLPDAMGENVLPSNVVRMDLEDADMVLIGSVPTYVVETSARRKQGYWLLERKTPDHPPIQEPHPLDAEAIEALSRNLAYNIPSADRTSWPLAMPMRLPGTTSFKYLAPHPVTVGPMGNVYTLADLEMVPDPPFPYTEDQIEFLNNPPGADTLKAPGALSLIEELLGHTPPRMERRMALQYRVKKPQGQRSSAIWDLILHLVQHGATRENIYWLVRLSDNNPYQELRFNADREICKDILRAEAFTHNRQQGARESINQMRDKNEGPRYMRMDQLKNVVISNMRAEGDFIKVSDSQTYYIRRDRGRPISIDRMSPQLDALLDIQYGINASEAEHNYVLRGLCAWTRESLAVNGMEKALTYYDHDLHNLFIHTGRRDVYRVDENRVERVVDGAYNIVFPWLPQVDSFGIDFTELERPWWQILVGDSVPTVINMTHAQATALVTAWFMFLLLRDIAPSRPILAMMGQPGSGKTTFFKRIYALLYGDSKSISGLTSPTNFDHAMSTDALVVMDNADDTSKWFLDRLAQSSSKLDVSVRELYTNLGTSVQHRHAMLGLTAHKAEYNRADIADRFLIIMLERFEGRKDIDFIPEGMIVPKLMAQRAQLWGAIIKDFQLLFKMPMPLPHESPSFRIKDFSTVGVWCLRALDAHYDTNMVSDFEGSIKSLGYSQRAFALEDETLLVQAAKTMLIHTQRKEGNTVDSVSEWHRPKDLFLKLRLLSGNQEQFTLRYTNESKLSRHLVSVQRSLEDVVVFERALSSTVGVEGQPNYVWRIGPPTSKNGSSNGNSGH